MPPPPERSQQTIGRPRVIGQRLPSLEQILQEQAQELEEDFPTRFAFNGAPLLMRAKGGDAFNWIMHNHWLTVAVNRSSKSQILAAPRRTCGASATWVRSLWMCISSS